MLEEQLKEIFTYNEAKEKALKSSHHSSSQPPKESFIPYKNEGHKKLTTFGSEIGDRLAYSNVVQPIRRNMQSKSQRHHSQFTVAKSQSRKDKAKQGNKSSSRAYNEKVGSEVLTPRYTNKNIRLLKSKQAFVQHQKQASNYNQRSRQAQVCFFS